MDAMKHTEILPPRTFPDCSYLHLTNFLRHLIVLEEFFLCEFVQSFFLLRCTANIGHSSSFTLSSYPDRLVERWWAFFVMSNDSEVERTLFTWLDGQVHGEIAAIILLGFHIIINDLLGHWKPALLSLKRIWNLNTFKKLCICTAWLMFLFSDTTALILLTLWNLSLLEIINATINKENYKPRNFYNCGVKAQYSAAVETSLQWNRIVL